MRILSKALTVAAAAIAVATPTLVLAGPAAAAGRDGTCASGEFCYYYNSYEAGSVSDFTGSLADYGTTQPSCYEFKGPGNGQGVCVKNNAASVWNRSSKTVRVYFNSNYGGSHQDFAAGSKGNLNATLKNNNASHQFLAKSGGAQTPRDDFDYNQRGFATNQCTAFAAYRIASRLGVPSFNNYWHNQHWGDAEHWDDAARAAGITVNKTPTVGGIAVNEIHVSSVDGVRHGHVAYINRVYSDGSFDVEEYNWNVSHGYGTRSHMRVSNVDPNFQWIIHF